MTILNAQRSWIFYVVMIARIFAASTLLLGACTEIFQPAPLIKLTSFVQLLLGIAIAVDWKTRYAAGLVLLGTFATSLWAALISNASLRSHVATIIALAIASSFLICSGRNNPFRGHLSIGENSRLPSSQPGADSPLLSDPNMEVTIRLEKGFLQNLYKERCIFTIHGLSGSAPKENQEVLYARDDS